MACHISSSGSPLPLRASPAIVSCFDRETPASAVSSARSPSSLKPVKQRHSQFLISHSPLTITMLPHPYHPRLPVLQWCSHRMISRLPLAITMRPHSSCHRLPVYCLRVSSFDSSTVSTPLSAALSTKSNKTATSTALPPHHC